jgi:hypothetical protein
MHLKLLEDYIALGSAINFSAAARMFEYAQAEHWQGQYWQIGLHFSTLAEKIWNLSL